MLTSSQVHWVRFLLMNHFFFFFFFYGLNWLSVDLMVVNITHWRLSMLVDSINKTSRFSVKTSFKFGSLTHIWQQTWNIMHKSYGPLLWWVLFWVHSSIMSCIFHNDMCIFITISWQFSVIFWNWWLCTTNSFHTFHWLFGFRWTFTLMFLQIHITS